MTLRALTIPIFVYTVMGGLANPAAAQALDASARDAVATLRTDDMRKLVIHEGSVEASDVAYQGPDGAETTLAASNGKLRLINFWATWCAPCREEMPALQALQEEFGGEGFEVMLIATGRNSSDAIERFFEEEEIAMETGLDQKGALAKDMGVPGLPVTVILSREGREIARLMGEADWSGESARAIVTELLAR